MRTLLIAAALAACGGNDHNAPDAAPDSDTTAPQLVSTSPADASAHNSILTEVTATFDKSLDPASIDATTFALSGLGGIDVPQGTVSYDDATKTITFTPLLPLTHDLRYVLTIGGVRDLAGNTFAGTAVKWRTTINANVRTIQRNISNAIVNYSTSTVDTDGHVAQTIGCADAGVDGVFMTADDVFMSRTDFTRNADGLVTKRVAYNIGADGKPNTGDDTVNSYVATTYDTDGAFVESFQYTGAGVDGIWFTADDVVFRHITSSHGFHPAQILTFTNAGVDGVWNTADDRGTSYTLSTYDARQRLARLENHGTGTDGIPLTSDDAVTSHIDYTYQPDGSYRLAIYNAAGPDGIWFTADDVVASWNGSTTASDGTIVRQQDYNDKGTDATWFTSDDVTDSLDAYTNSAAKLTTLDLFYSAPGADAMWGTADDAIGDYATWSYTATGDTTVFKLYNGPGTDTVWQTADDSDESEQDYDIAH